ncbi:hypothetical protein pb186bvf_013573 [Paramecium bursaria]
MSYLKLIKEVIDLRQHLFDDDDKDITRYKLLCLIIEMKKIPKDLYKVFFDNDFTLLIMKNIGQGKNDDLLIELLKLSYPYWTDIIKVMFVKHLLGILIILTKIQNYLLHSVIVGLISYIKIKDFPIEYKRDITRRQNHQVNQPQNVQDISLFNDIHIWKFNIKITISRMSVQFSFFLLVSRNINTQI